MVDDLAPTARPRAKRAISKLGQEPAAAIQIEAVIETKQEKKMVPRRPK